MIAFPGCAQLIYLIFPPASIDESEGSKNRGGAFKDELSKNLLAYQNPINLAVYVFLKPLIGFPSESMRAKSSLKARFSSM